jgi:hypothetical protein
LKKIGTTIPGAEGVVDEETGKVGRGRREKTNTLIPSPTKGKLGGGGGGKKRKVEDVKEEKEE